MTYIFYRKNKTTNHSKVFCNISLVQRWSCERSYHSHFRTPLWTAEIHGCPLSSFTTAAVSCPELFRQVNQVQETKSLKILSRFPCIPKKVERKWSNGPILGDCTIQNVQTLCSALLTEATLVLIKKQLPKAFTSIWSFCISIGIVVTQKLGFRVDCEIFFSE